jgi:hypothetical protein
MLAHLYIMDPNDVRLFTVHKSYFGEEKLHDIWIKLEKHY